MDDTGQIYKDNFTLREDNLRGKRKEDIPDITFKHYQISSRQMVGKKRKILKTI